MIHFVFCGVLGYQIRKNQGRAYVLGSVIDWESERKGQDDEIY